MKLIKNSYYRVKYQAGDESAFEGVAKYVGTHPHLNSGNKMRKFHRLEDIDEIKVMYFYDEDIVEKVDKKTAKIELEKRLKEILDKF